MPRVSLLLPCLHRGGLPPGWWGPAGVLGTEQGSEGVGCRPPEGGVQAPDPLAALLFTPALRTPRRRCARGGTQLARFRDEVLDTPGRLFA